jgi:hypothetical protein
MFVGNLWGSLQDADLWGFCGVRQGVFMADLTWWRSFVFLT